MLYLSFRKVCRCPWIGLVLLALTGGATPAEAGFFSCRAFLGLFSRVPTLVPGVPDRNLDVWEGHTAGDEVKVDTGRKTVTGTLLELDFDHLVVWDGKSAREIPLSRVRSIQTSDSPDRPALPEGMQRLLARNQRMEKWRRAYLRFRETDADAWRSLHDPVDREIARLRQMSRAERKRYLRRVGDQILATLRAKTGITNLGLHFNLHGGQGYQFAGGVRATYGGDIALNYDTNARAKWGTYLFQTRAMNLYDILNFYPGALPLGRMGNALTVFNMDSPYFSRARQQGGLVDESNNFLEFNPTWLAKQPSNQGSSSLIGIPADTFLIPPAEVFQHTRKKLGLTGGLSRDEETLSTMRYLEQRILNSVERETPNG